MSNSGSKFNWKKVYDDKFREIRLEELKKLAASSRNVTIRESAYKAYSITQSKDNIDHFVGEALWNYDEKLYDELRGYTKTARLGRGFHNLLGYCAPTKYKKQLFTESFNSCYESVLSSIGNKFVKSHFLSIDEASKHVPTTSSAGVLHPGKKKGEVMDQAKKWVRMAINRWKDGKEVGHLPYKLGLRGHLSPINENKTRAIWMSAVETNIMENMVFRDFYRQMFNRPDLSKIILTGADVMPRLHEYIQTRPDTTFVNTDVSGWDHNPCRFLLKDVFFKIFKPLIQFEEPWQEKMFDYLVTDFIFSGLLLPDGSLFVKQHGVPSGSFMTLLINSVANYIVQRSTLQYLGVYIHHPKVLGDDFSFMMGRIEEDDFDSFINVLSSTVFQFFSIVIKPEKVVITNDLKARKFIGYQIRNGRLFREDDDLFKGVLYPESSVKNLNTSFTRLFSFLIIGGSNSVRFTEFYQRYLSGYYTQLVQLGQDLIDNKVLKSGSLRVFKHVYHIDTEVFESFTIDDFRKISLAKLPFFLTLGSRFVLG